LQEDTIRPPDARLCFRGEPLRVLVYDIALARRDGAVSVVYSTWRSEHYPPGFSAGSMDGGKGCGWHTVKVPMGR